MDIKMTPALVFLVCVNLLPVAGVLMFGWDISMIVALYWLETVIIGIVNVPKMWACTGPAGAKLFLTIFFGFHFGMFCSGHYIFLTSLFDTGDVFKGIKERGPVFWTALSLLGSHLFSMAVNFFGKREYVGRNIAQQMFFPYGRIVVMHLVIIFGGFLAMVFGAPIVLLLLLIALKIVMDILAHTLEHSGKPMHVMQN